MRIGILHSLSGTMAMAETPLVDAVLMAIAEINAGGGILGELIEVAIEDGGSDPQIFATKARELFTTQKITTLFGCWTSASRKAVKPIVEECNAQLWYPLQYEGLEQSDCIFYTGVCANQQLEPALAWLFEQQKTRFYLVGSDYVFPRTAHKIIRAKVKQSQGELLGEDFRPLGEQDFQEIIDRIAKTRPDVVLNTLNGDSNIAFYRQFYEAEIRASDIPILAFSASEPEFQQLGEMATGHYAAWSYFQSLDRPENQLFLEHYQSRYGINRVTSDAIATAYTQIYLWKQGVELAASFEVEKVRKAVIGTSLLSPGGLVKMEANHHLWKPLYIGQLLASGQFSVKWESEQHLKPLPWLGVEELSFLDRDIIIELLGTFSQGMQDRWEVEQKTQQVEETMAQLQTEIIERQRVEQALRESQRDLEIILENTTSHFDSVHEVQYTLNTQLQEEIRQREVIETILQESQAELMALFGAMDDVILVLDRNGRCLKVAPTKSNKFIRAPQEQIGKTLEEILPPAQANLQLQYIHLTLETNTSQDLEYSLIIEGEERWFYASVAPLTLESVLWVARDITESKKAEQQLRQSEERFRELVSNIPGAVYRCLNYEDWKVEFISEAIESISGYPATDFMGDNQRTFASLVTPEDKDNMEKIVREALAKKESYLVEYPIFHADGSIRWVYEKGRGIFNPDGSLAYLDGVVFDITDRRRAEKERDRFFKNSFDLMCIVDLQGTILQLNPAWEKTFGFLPEDLYRKTIYSFVHPEDIKKSIRAFAQMRSGKPLASFESRHRTNTGEYRWLSWNAIPILTEGLVYGFARDITTQKAAQDALELAEARYRSIFENTAEGLFQTTRSGHFLSANPALARIYGYESPEELLENLTSITEELYVNPRNRLEFINRIEKDGKITDFESQVYRKDGQIIWISENAHLVHDAQGNFLYYEGSVVDITERKVFQEALRYQQQQTEDLLLNILPAPIAERLKRGEIDIADQYANVGVLFADIVNFTELSAGVHPKELVKLLNQIFSEFDRLVEIYNLEKIKTIGDAYLVVGGLPTPGDDWGEAIADMALAMRGVITRFHSFNGEPLQLRIGIHTGPVVAGAIGTKKFIYDLWGDTVNVASRMESQGEKGQIQVTETVYESLKDRYLLQKRGSILVKGKGTMTTYWLQGKRS